MKCPKCGKDQPEGYSECLHCGIIFEKYLKYAEKAGGMIPADDRILHEGQREETARHSGMAPDSPPVTPDENADNPFAFGGRLIVFLILALWGARLMTSSVEDGYLAGTFLHLVNLPFHEAGHIFFRPLGRFMASLGGSLGQLLMPLICMGTFLIKTRDRFGASVALWWFGENFLDMAPYINDANRLVLPLLGGNVGSDSPYGFHDWEYILTETGLIGYSQTLARTACIIGDIVIISSLLWAGFLLFRMFRGIRTGSRHLPPERSRASR